MELAQKKKKVFVGVSGGVDSSVALAVLQEQGFDVTGVFLKVWSPDFLPCQWRDERRSAMRVCATLGVPFLTLDCEKEYKENVVDYMIKEYTAGRTPNPDVFCNKYVKFGIFLKKALEFGADFVATGHYAQIETVRSENNTTTYYIKEASDILKDQSYFLCELGQDELSHALFPIGHLEKSKVRELARTYNLPTAEKKDSQGLCFIGTVDMKAFLKHFITTSPGDVLDEAGETVGTHQGSELYTIGERHGFTIIKKTPHDHKLFVVKKDVIHNTITVSNTFTTSSNIANLQTVKLIDVHSTSGHLDDIVNTPLLVCFRYHQEKIPCQLAKEVDGVLRLSCTTTIGTTLAIAPGQVAVLYRENICVGCGVVSLYE